MVTAEAFVEKYSAGFLSTLASELDAINKNDRLINSCMASTTCFARQYRLLQSREFQRVFSNTQCKSADQLLTILAASNDCDHARLGLAISKKRIKSAVARNQLKRLVRDSFRRHQNELQNIDIIVIGHTRAAQVSNQEILDCLNQHWKNLAARCKNLSSL